MQISSYGISDQGKVRQANEDSLFLNDTHQFYAVADGLGGLPGGAEASQRIVQLLERTMSQVNSAEERVDLNDLMLGIHQIITQEGNDAHPFTGIGSTLTIGQIVGNQLFIGHVGDSAAYLLRGEDLEKLTIDHTMEQELIDREGEAARAIMPPEYQHTLTRCIGQGNPLRVENRQISVQAGDRLLLCTDGLNKVLSADHIKEELARPQSPRETCRRLTLMANENEGPDNITLIVVYIS
ncbi:protein phosphatase 2C domain-containing protein [Coraliomargarita sp. SDUM461004]|uniref:Protein phosphatase 2C domain-containing protein n=1 Tax=Thalassobacterium sedimentorum TaxID=3041258 RepID=A0ABU1AH45_9BACT|nr:protein phosphatase 2C domain-containing protein [Coraliomargarita sp. SDUM461004]MDQ8194142.1 protein phosphatase 2C domain-containing protein [Coraliomargarita sp. SDUM461004]